jgi:Outer membrane efflux protein
MRRFAGFGWGLLVLAGAATGASAGGHQEDRPEEITRLLGERQKVLRAAAGVLMTQYRAGRVDFQRVAQVQRALLGATLDLPQPPEKRLAALRGFRELADATVKVAEARFKVGTATRADVLEAQAVLLEARINLLREQAKTRPRKERRPPLGHP